MLGIKALKKGWGGGGVGLKVVKQMIKGLECLNHVVVVDISFIIC